MIKFHRTIAVGGVGLAAIVGASGAMAQAVPNLGTYVTAANGASQVQIATAAAVQRTCASLGSGVLGGGSANTGGRNLAQNTSRRDLYLRCNELVQTAQQLQNVTGVTLDRSLGMSTEQLLSAVQQVSGEEVSAQGSLAKQVTSGQFANIGGRLNALRLGGAAIAARGRVASLDSEPRNRELYAANDTLSALGGGASSDTQGADRPWGWFVESSYGFGDHDQSASEDAFDFDSVSVTTGTDYNFGSAVVGFSVGFDRYTADFDTATLVSGGEAEIEGVSGSLFGAYFGERLSLSGIASYGSLKSDITRRTQYTPANPAACALGCGASRDFTGSPDGSYVALGVTLSHDFSLGGWDLTPSLSGSYRDADIDSYSERDMSANGGLALAYDEQSIKSTRSIVGLALSRPISKSFGVLTPNFRAEWHHEFEDDARAVRAKYAVENEVIPAERNNFACAISCFSILSNPVDADYGIAGAGLSATFAQRMQAYVYYEALLGADELSSNSIALGLRGSF